MSNDNGPAVEMPRYECHKKVLALQIQEIATVEDADPAMQGTLSFVERRFAPVEVDAEWMQRHKPKIGGYYVVYEDGYKSFSPADAFESGYTRIEE